MKRLHIMIILLFFIPIFILGFISIVDEDLTVSAIENRTLSSKPKLCLENIFNSSFMKDFENYYLDTFPFRENLLGVNRKLNNVYYATGNSGVVVVSNNFSVGIGDGVGLDDIPDAEKTVYEEESVEKEGLTPKPIKPIIDEGVVTKGIIIMENSAKESFSFSEDLTTYFAEVIEYFNALMPDERIYVMIPPHAGEFYSPDNLYKEEESVKTALTHLKSQLNNSIYVDAYSELANHQDEYIFFRTDHHWTARGAYYGYKAFIEAVGLEPVNLSDLDTGFVPDFLGSMHKAVAKYEQSEGLRDDPDYVEYFIPKVNYTATSYSSTDMVDGKELSLVNSDYDASDNKYFVFLGQDSGLLKITTDVNNGRKLVIVRDSYGHALLPFIVHNYEEIYVLEPRYLNTNLATSLKLDEFVEKIDPDEILFMNYAMFISGGYWFQWIDVIEALQ